MKTESEVFEAQLFSAYLEQSVELILDSVNAQKENYFTREALKKMLSDAFLSGLLYGMKTIFVELTSNQKKIH